MVGLPRRHPWHVAILATVLGIVTAATSTRYYVSLGDSYAIGYQPGPSATRHGYADQVVAKATRRGYRL